jgi:FMN phosphatase YigB (HAD superfamily)
MSPAMDERIVRMAERVTLVVFDLGGVVVRICRTWEQARRCAGVEHRPGMDEPALAARRRDAVREYERGRIDCDEFFRRVADATAGCYQPHEVRRVHDAWLLGEYEGVSELVDALHGAGIDTGVLSNTNHAHWQRMAAPPAPGSAGYPTPWRTRHCHASHLLGLAKPDRAIYDEFARRSGRADRPGEILFFDDLPDNVDAARDAGWRSERIDHDADTAAQMRAYLASHGVLLRS